MIPPFWRCSVPWGMLPIRKQIRLRQHSYGAGAAYHVTICTLNRRRLLSTIHRGRIHLSPIGAVVADQLNQIPSWWTDLTVVEVAIMPDHVHLLLELGDQAPVTLPRIVCRLKGLTSREARRHGLVGRGPLWQRGYYESVIRSPIHLARVRHYVRNNPSRWGAGI